MTHPQICNEIMCPYYLYVALQMRFIMYQSIIVYNIFFSRFIKMERKISLILLVNLMIPSFARGNSLMINEINTHQEGSYIELLNVDGNELNLGWSESSINFMQYTLQKKEVFDQVYPQEKCFKICYVYGKRKSPQFFFLLHLQQLSFFPYK